MRTLPLFVAMLGGCSFSATAPATSDSPVVIDGPISDAAIDAKLPDAAIDAGPGRVAGAQAQWKFNEGMGQIAADSAGLTPSYDLTRNPATVVNTEWSNGGLTFKAGPTPQLIQGSYAASAVRLIRATTTCLANKTATLEAWIAPSNETQGISPRPVIIAGITANINSRSFEIAQVGRNIIARTRTDTPNAQDLQAMDVVTAGTLIHVALVQEQATQRLYINGVEKDSQVSPLMAWAAYSMYVGGDIGVNAPWLGTARAVVLYCSALTSAQVQGNFAFGPTL